MSTRPGLGRQRTGEGSTPSSWRTRRAIRTVLLAVLAVVVVVLLFTLVFPWIDRTFVADPVLDNSSAPPPVGADG